MITLITIVILIACLILAFFILIQQPKGGGLAGTFGGLSTQVMGVKQSTDVMEKGTWTSMGIIAGLCIVCVMFFDTPRAAKETRQPQSTSAPAQQQQPAPAGGGQAK